MRHIADESLDLKYLHLTLKLQNAALKGNHSLALYFCQLKLRSKQNFTKQKDSPN